MGYTEVWDFMTGRPSTSSIQRIEDGAVIPFDRDNKDYLDFLAWLAEGNEPQIAVDPTPAKGGRR